MTCYLNEIDFSEWGLKMVEPLNGGPYPLAGEFELIERCNMACKHCFINQPAGDALARSRELSTAQVKDILDQIADAGCLQLLLTGGEPLLRPDFPEIYLHARRRGLMVLLFTNATMVTPEIIEVLKYAPPVLVEVSIYGVTRETYESVTGLPGSFDRFMNGIHLLKDSGLPLATKSALLSLNKHELPLMKAFAEELGVRFGYDGSMWPRLKGQDRSADYRLSMEDVLALDQNDPERMQTWMEYYNASMGKSPKSERYAFNCGAGYRSFHIDSRGNLDACMMVRKPSFNILELGFQKAWEELGKFRWIERTKPTPCASCSAASMCIQCPGWSQMVHDDNESVVDYVCKLTKTRERNINYNLSLIEENISNG